MVQYSKSSLLRRKTKGANECNSGYNNKVMLLAKKSSCRSLAQRVVNCKIQYRVRSCSSHKKRDHYKYAAGLVAPFAMIVSSSDIAALDLYMNISARRCVNACSNRNRILGLNILGLDSLQNKNTELK